MVNKKIAIDLSWIKIDKSGGVENHTINLLKNLKNKNAYFIVTPNQLLHSKYSCLTIGGQFYLRLPNLG